jgi:hypothetical protein
MEDSMKMMSWSRYHCLSLLRAERRLRAARLHKIRPRSEASPAIRPRAFGAGSFHAKYFQAEYFQAKYFQTKYFPTKYFRAKYFQFVIRIFRT